jgi:hypothetical protein
LSAPLSLAVSAQSGYIDKVGSRRAFAMGAKQLRGLNLILLVVRDEFGRQNAVRR